MSIYSGFATRNQEQFYDKMIYNLISTLLLRLTKYYRQQPIDEATFLKIIYEQERSLKKMEKRKYLEPKYSQLLTKFKRDISHEAEIQMYEVRGNREERSKGKHNHQLNRTLSGLGKEFGQLRANLDKFQKIDTLEVEQNQLQPPLVRIQQHKRHVSKRKRKTKKSSIKSNLDIWQMRQQKPPELPSLHPLQHMQRTIMSKTKFNNFSQKVRSKDITDLQDNEQEGSLQNILARAPKFKSRLYFK